MNEDEQEKLRLLKLVEAVLAFHIIENNTEALNLVFERVSAEITNIHGRITTKDRAREVLTRIAATQTSKQALLG